VLVGKDDAGTVLLQSDSPDQPEPDPGLFPLPQVLLFVHVEGGVGVPEKDPAGFPLLKRPAGPEMSILRPVIPRPILPQDEPDDVVGMATVQVASSVGGDDVVGRGNDGREVPDLLCVVPNPPEGQDMGHAHLQDW
jgi:hypothetical protein